MLGGPALVGPALVGPAPVGPALVALVGPALVALVGPALVGPALVVLVGPALVGLVGPAAAGGVRQLPVVHAPLLFWPSLPPFFVWRPPDFAELVPFPRLLFGALRGLRARCQICRPTQSPRPDAPHGSACELQDSPRGLKCQRTFCQRVGPHH